MLVLQGISFVLFLLGTVLLINETISGLPLWRRLRPTPADKLAAAVHQVMLQACTPPATNPVSELMCTVLLLLPPAVNDQAAKLAACNRCCKARRHASCLESNVYCGVASWSVSGVPAGPSHPGTQIW